MYDSVHAENISELVGALPRFVGSHPAESFLGVIIIESLIQFVILADLDAVLTDPALPIRLSTLLKAEAAGEPVVLLAITEHTKQGTQALAAIRRLTLAVNVVDTAIVRTSEYARDGGRGPRMPLVLVPPLEHPHEGVRTRDNGLDLVRR